MATARLSGKRALISVSDKTGLADLARGLASLGIEIVSTGSTGKSLEAEGIAVTFVEAVTGFPEIMDGRVKTLHPKIHGGLLAVRDSAAHRDAMQAHGIAGIDILAVNLYPFEETVARAAPFDEIVENIDIGGPALIRAAAKNHRFVTVIVDPADYVPVLSYLTATGEVPEEERRKLAAKAFARTASYDAAIAAWFAKELDYRDAPWRSFSGKLRDSLRYGENPHQWGAFYADAFARTGIATATQVQGKALSYNNIADTDAAFDLVSEFDPATSTVAIIKHANPCGVAIGKTLAEAYARALRCDPVSAFGGIVALNRELDAATATEIAKIFTEVIVAPSASDEAQAILSKKSNLRLLVTGGLADTKAEALTVRSVGGGLLVQSRDARNVDDAELKVVTRRAPTKSELADLKFASKVAKHVKSNAIVYARDGATVGIGAGQMSRLDSTLVAHRKSIDAAKAAGLDGALTAGSVVASDAFFPFADGLIAAIEAGATAVIQPGGSVRDDEVIAAADKAGIAMVFTGLRHFRH